MEVIKLRILRVIKLIIQKAKAELRILAEKDV